MVICAQPGTGEAPNKRRAEAAAAAPAGAKRQKKNCGAARAASLNTVLAAVQERAVRQGSGAMDASVGCAPTTVEDCLKASSFGVIRKVKFCPVCCAAPVDLLQGGLVFEDGRSQEAGHRVEVSCAPCFAPPVLMRGLVCAGQEDSKGSQNRRRQGVGVHIQPGEGKIKALF